MDETSRKRQLEDNDPSSTVSSSKRSRTLDSSGRAQRRNLDAESSSSTDTSSIASSRDSSDESSSPEDDSEDEATPSAGATSSSSSSSPSSSSSSPSSSESDSGADTELEDAENDVDESDGRSDQVPITNVSARPKPRIQRINGNSSILSRISSFLPRLRAANDDLQRDIDAGRTKDVIMDDVDEGDEEAQYIEMNLGLGVLEEERSERGSRESSSEESENSIPDGEPGPSATSLSKNRRDTKVLDKLMGNKTKPKKPAIEEMEG